MMRNVLEVALDFKVTETIPDQELEEIIKGFYQGYSVIPGTIPGAYRIWDRGRNVALVEVENGSNSPSRRIVITATRLE